MDFYNLDGLLRLAPRLTTREQGKRWVEYNGPVSPQLVDAVCASDADVVAFTPYLYHPTVATIGRVPMPAVFHPAAHDEPALYFSVFRGTFGDADAFCFYTHSERTLVERMYPVAERPQVVLGLGVGDSEGTGRRGADLLGLGDRPYLVSVGRVDEHKGSKMLATYFATYKERHPGPLALALVGPVAVELEPHPDIVISGPVEEADKWDIVRDSLVAVSASALESFSLVVIEAWVDRVPVLVNGSCGAYARARRALGRRAVVLLVSRVRSGVGPPGGRPRAARQARRPGSGLRGHPLPLAGVGLALRRLLDTPSSSGGGARRGCSERSADQGAAATRGGTGTVSTSLLL